VNKMNEKKNKAEKSKRSLYIVFSIIASIAIWMYVAYVQNPDKSIPISNISVVYVGEDALEANNLIVTNRDTSTLSLTFSGKRNTITKLDSSEITATVDLSAIVDKYTATAGVYQLPYTLDYGGTVMASSVSVSNTSKNYVSVTVERLVKNAVPVSVKNSIVPAEGYVLEDEELSFETLEISGPQSVVSSVAGAVAEITREDVEKTISEDVPLTLVDENGAVVESEYLSLAQETVTVTIPVLMQKEVMLYVDYIDAVSANGTDAVADILPESIILKGDPDILSGIDRLSVGTVDLVSFATDYRNIFDITIPAGMTNMSDRTTATVNVTLPGLSTKKISVEDIAVSGTPAGQQANVLSSKVDVMLRGTADALEQITAEDIRVVADLASPNGEANAYNARVTLNGSYTVDVIGTYTVRVELN